MRRLLFRFALFCLLQVAVGLLILPAALSEQRVGYLASFEDKIDLLECDGPPRILLVGGSSAAFGVYSPLLEEAFDRPVVNLGLHGALGLDFYLSVARAHVREGDLVVLLIEYSLLADRNMAPLYARNLLRECPRAARYMLDDLVDLKPFFDQMAISELAHWTQNGTRVQWNRMQRWWKHRRLDPAQRKTVARREARRNSLAQQRLRLRTRKPYTRFSFNEHGDMVGHHGAAPPGFVDGPVTVNGNTPGFRKAVAKMNRFAEACQQKGATVVFSYSPMTDAIYEESAARFKVFHRQLTTSLEFPVIAEPKDAAFPTSHFFDARNHLAKVGQMKRTRMLLSAIHRHISVEMAADAPVRR